VIVARALNVAVRSPIRVGAVVWAVVAAAAGIPFAWLVVNGFWYVAVALLLVPVAFVLVHRQPLVGVAVWLVITPFVTASESVAVRQIFWLVHRVLPLGLLALVLAGLATGMTRRRLARLSVAEALMGGFVLAALFSIATSSGSPATQAIFLYDRVIAPMCLYLVVRLLQPSVRDLRWLAAIAALVLLVEVPIGILSVASPGILPQAWIVKSRATGTFGDPDVFGVTMIACGVILLHAGTIARRRSLRAGSILAFILAMLMVFLTFSRANWVAGLVTIAGCLWIYRHRIGSLVIAVPVVLGALLISGALRGPLMLAEGRLESQKAVESALARLPVVMASVRMFEARPVMGWGYGNFDLYSRGFQDKVGNLVYPEKEHASHNLFLSILAEMGLVGFVLFLGPTAYWGQTTLRTFGLLPLTHRRFVIGLWLVIAAFFIVNNFSVMKSPYGLGLWWLTLGLLGSTVDRFRPSRREDDAIHGIPVSHPQPSGAAP
jgi:O-antigen ligase